MEGSIPTFSISFQYYNNNSNDNNNGNGNNDNDNDNALKLLIQQRLVSSGLMKLAFSGILRKSTDNDGSILGFCQSVGRAVNDARTEISTLQQQLADTQQALKSWKDTAEKLDRDVWQNEKDELLDNFLTLWNEGQGRAKQQIEKLKDELEETKAAATTATTLSKKQRAASRALQLDAPDDLDQPSQEPISLEQVAALAQGRKTHAAPARQRREPILDASQIVSVSTLKQQAEEYQKRKANNKKNKVTSQTMEEDSPPPATKRAKIKKKESDDSSDHDEEQENSEEEAMRMAIRASVRKPDDDKDESDASF
jgi:hypothetical protein